MGWDLVSRNGVRQCGVSLWWWWWRRSSRGVGSQMMVSLLSVVESILVGHRPWDLAQYGENVASYLHGCS